MSISRFFMWLKETYLWKHCLLEHLWSAAKCFANITCHLTYSKDEVFTLFSTLKYYHVLCLVPSSSWDLFFLKNSNQSFLGGFSHNQLAVLRFSTSCLSSYPSCEDWLLAQFPVTLIYSPDWKNLDELFLEWFYTSWLHWMLFTHLQRISSHEIHFNGPTPVYSILLCFLWDTEWPKFP